MVDDERDIVVAGDMDRVRVGANGDPVADT